LWRLGQVKPGGLLRLKPIRFEQAIELMERVEGFIEVVRALVEEKSERMP
jgi:allophanate hydrolase subunit 2